MIVRSEQSNLSLDPNLYPPLQNNSPSFSQTLNDFLHEISLNPGSTSKLPFEFDVNHPGLIYADDNLIVYEKPPALKNIFYIPLQVDSMNSHSSESTVYALPIPWQVYFVKYNSYSDFENPDIRKYVVSSVGMYFSNSALYSSDQELYLPPLPNFYCNGLLCNPMFDNMQDIIRYPNTLQGLMSSSYDWVWNSGTNADLTEAVLQIPIHYKTLQNTVFCNAKSLSNYIPNPYHQYYIDSGTLHAYYTSWEKISLDSILDYNWPAITPNYTARFIEYYKLCYQGHHSRSLDDNLFPAASDVTCCEDCQYYDEDGEAIEGECVEDGSCSCHRSDNIVNNPANFRTLLHHYGLINHSTFYDIFHNLYHKTVDPSLKYNQYFLSNCSLEIQSSM
jgi:hypothetical protein